MFTSSKSGWYLPFFIFAIAFVLYASLGFWFNAWISSSSIKRQHPQALTNILSEETIDTLYSDARFHQALFALSEAVAKTSTDFGEQYKIESLELFGKNLTGDLARIKGTGKLNNEMKTAVQSPDNMAGLGGTNEQASIAGLGGLMGLGENGTAGLSGIISDLGNSLVEGAATPALFLGIGLGMGAEQGLNITDLDQSTIMAAKVAEGFNTLPTGINLAAQNIGSGLSAQLAPSLANLGGNAGQIGMASFSLAQGIGQGTASGLNLTQQQIAPSNSSNITGIANNFGLGLSSSIASNVDLRQLMTQLGTSGDLFMSQIPEIAAAAGKGLGEGAKNGLGLDPTGSVSTKRQAATQIDVPGAVGDFARGFGQSFLQSADLSKLSVAGDFKLDLKAMIMPVASGAGKGIGNGAAIGLGFKAATEYPPIDEDVSSPETTELLVQQFAQGAVANFVMNSTAIDALVNLTMMGNGTAIGQDFKASQAAEGAARGLVEGVVNALSSVGGVKNMIAGNFSKEAMMNLPALPETEFDDSVNGSVVAFARGLGGEGTFLVVDLVKQLGMPSASNASLTAKKSIVQTREVGVVPRDSFTSRADEVSLAFDSETVSQTVQVGVDTITCSGVGGLAAVALGLTSGMDMKMDMMKSAVPLDDQVLAALPKEPVLIMSEGNKFEIKITETSVTINELELVPFAVFTALHVALTTFAFFYALPAYIALGAMWRLSVLIGHPFSEVKNNKWRMRILLGVFFPTAVAGIVLGIVGMGQSQHFHTIHGIFGLVTLVFVVPSVITTFFRLRTKVPVPDSSAFLGFKQIPRLLKSDQKIYLISAFFIQQTLAFSQFAWIQGFSDLRSVSLCIVDAVLTAPAVVGVMTIILFLQVSALALLGTRTWFEQRIAKKNMLLETSSSSSSDADGDSEKATLRSKITPLKLRRSDTMKTFGFDEQPPPSANAAVLQFPRSPYPRHIPKDPDDQSSNATAAPPPTTATRPNIQTRTTNELIGREDSQIGWPINIRKDDEQFDSDKYVVTNNALDNRGFESPPPAPRTPPIPLANATPTTTTTIGDDGSSFYALQPNTYVQSRYPSSTPSQLFPPPSQSQQPPTFYNDDKDDNDPNPNNPFPSTTRRRRPSSTTTTSHLRASSILEPPESHYATSSYADSSASPVSTPPPLQPQPLQPFTYNNNNNTTTFPHPPPTSTNQPPTEPSRRYTALKETPQRGDRWAEPQPPPEPRLVRRFESFSRPRVAGGSGVGTATSTYMQNGGNVGSGGGGMAGQRPSGEEVRQTYGELVKGAGAGAGVGVNGGGGGGGGGREGEGARYDGSGYGGGGYL